MPYYLFLTNTTKFIIDDNIVKNVKDFLTSKIKSKFKFKILEQGNAYEWKFSSNSLNASIINLLKKKFNHIPIDINFIKITPPRIKKLFIADMDSTMIKEESLDELSKFFGKDKLVSEITKQAMNGKLDFNKALQKRVILLKGLPLKKIQEFNKKINFTEGGLELVNFMNNCNSTTVLVSGGFIPIIKHVAKKLNFMFYHGNQFEYQKDEINKKVLTGDVKKPILNKDSKLKILLYYKKKFKLSKTDIIAVGDGANDIAIIKHSGIGVAFNGKELLKSNADIRLLDVRNPEEREQACIENSLLLDQELVEEMLGSWDPESPLMFYCHLGQRSRQAAQYFTSQGFQQVYNISDGISGWSSSVDSSIPQY